MGNLSKITQKRLRKAVEGAKSTADVIRSLGHDPAREIGATDNAIRKHLRREGVSPLPKRLTRLQRKNSCGTL